MAVIERPLRARRSRRGRGEGWRAERSDRRRRRKSVTKAELRRRLRARIDGALKAIGVANRIPVVPEKAAHLGRAIRHLEAALESRPGSRALRQQLTLCREALWDLERGAADAAARRVEIVIGEA
ncbi:MAG: hypothetical protein PHN82_00090 [bacterium]|nr:hypothetical protein [bacterium]